MSLTRSLEGLAHRSAPWWTGRFKSHSPDYFRRDPTCNGRGNVTNMAMQAIRSLVPTEFPEEESIVPLANDSFYDLGFRQAVSAEEALKRVHLLSHQGLALLLYDAYDGDVFPGLLLIATEPVQIMGEKLLFGLKCPSTGRIGAHRVQLDVYSVHEARTWSLDTRMVSSCPSHTWQ